MIGSTVSHYRILEQLGAGGMGVVYRAEDTSLHRTVALKFLPPELTRDPEARERFRNEAQAASSLDHPNICTIHEIGSTPDGQMYLAMACYDGDTLKHSVKRGPLPIVGAIDLAIQLARGLQKAHDRGIVHRDIKPANIIITTDGVAKILDFGLAKLTGTAHVTRTGSTVGTVAYMAPEQLQGEDVDHRADIWSLGVVMYEMFTGRLPFRGEHEAAMIYSVVNEAPTDAAALQPQIPPVIASVIHKCLEKNRNDRFSKCQEIVDVLQQERNRITSQQTIQAARPSRLANIGWALLIVLIAGVLGAAAYWFVSSSSDSRAASSTSPSIAVLYLDNLTGDAKYDTFSSGMTEEIINALANIPGVLVIARNDVAQFRGKTLDIQEVGKSLGVTYVLEGSIRAEGSRLRVTCQAIQTRDRFHFWSQGYTREMKSTLDVQSDIAQQVALALKTRFAQKTMESKLGLPENTLVKQ